MFITVSYAPSHPAVLFNCVHHAVAGLHVPTEADSENPHGLGPHGSRPQDHSDPVGSLRQCPQQFSMQCLLWLKEA